MNCETCKWARKVIGDKMKREWPLLCILANSETIQEKNAVHQFTVWGIDMVGYHPCSYALFVKPSHSCAEWCMKPKK